MSPQQAAGNKQCDAEPECWHDVRRADTQRGNPRKKKRPKESHVHADHNDLKRPCILGASATGCPNDFEFRQERPDEDSPEHDRVWPHVREWPHRSALILALEFEGRAKRGYEIATMHLSSSADRCGEKTRLQSEQNKLRAQRAFANVSSRQP